MKQQEILEGNKLIAKFLNHNYDVIIHGELCGLGSAMEKIEYKLNYHKDWKLLMPVVEKICKDSWVNMRPSQLGKRGIGFCEIEYKDRFPHIFKESEIFIDAVYKAVIEFIKWFNENK